MKGRSIAEALLIFWLLQFILLFPEGVRDLIRWENRSLGGSYFTGVLMIVLGIIMIIARHYEFNEMGITAEYWKRSINYGFRGWIFFIIPQYILSYFLALGVSYRDNIELAGFLGVLVLLACFLMATRKEMLQASSSRLIISGLLILSPFILIAFVNNAILSLMKIYVWNILVGAFAEEFFYRGYLQSSINLEYGTNWRLGNIRFGPGLIVSSILYGLSRGLRIIKPWSGIYAISWGWTLYSFTLGIFYGIIRESSGDIIGSGVANSLIDAVGEGLLYVING